MKSRGGALVALGVGILCGTSACDSQRVQRDAAHVERGLEGAATESAASPRRAESVGVLWARAFHDPSVANQLALAEAYRTAARLTEAEAAYRKVLQRSPSHPIALHGLAEIASRRDLLPYAILRDQEAVAAKPNYWEAHLSLAEALRREGRFAEAYRSYEIVAKSQPESDQDQEHYGNALHGMASLDLEMGAGKRAARLLEELLSEQPEHPQAHQTYARVLELLGRHEEARREREIQQAIQASNPAAARSPSPIEHGTAPAQDSP
jgi:Flp pilus assembly protein TadD